MTNPKKKQLVVIGNGMVGHRFLEVAAELGLSESHRVGVLGEESRLAYDRVNLSKLFSGKTPEDLCLVESGSYDRNGIAVNLSVTATRIDRHRRRVRTSTSSPAFTAVRKVTVSAWGRKRTGSMPAPTMTRDVASSQKST